MEERPMEKLPKPSRAATLHIIVRRDQSPDDRESGEDLGGNRIRCWLWWLRWLIPATVEAWLTVPDAEAGLLRMLERVAVAVTWSAAVIATLFGASAAHLPPIGTTIVIVLEIVVPPVVMLRARRGDDDK